MVPKMKKIISFSLWGSDALYIIGALENILLAKAYYPDWTCRFYVASDCPAIKAIQDLGAETIIMPAMPTLDKTQSKWEESPLHQAMFWRFLALGDPTVERVIVRDCDSRVSEQEAIAVKEWEESGMLGHLMYGCVPHAQCILMPGLSGVVGGLFPNIQDMISDFILGYMDRFPGERWVFSDILFMSYEIFNTISFSTMRHGYGTPNPFKVDRPSGLGEFVGAVVNPELRGITWDESMFSTYNKEGNYI